MSKRALLERKRDEEGRRNAWSLYRGLSNNDMFEYLMRMIEDNDGSMASQSEVY